MFHIFFQRGNQIFITFISRLLLVSDPQNCNTICNTFIHEMFIAVAGRMRSIYIPNLMMGTFMKIDELLKFNWRALIIKPNNNWLAIFISFSHTSSGFLFIGVSVYKYHSFTQIILTFGLVRPICIARLRWPIDRKSSGSNQRAERRSSGFFVMKADPQQMKNRKCPCYLGFLS